MEVLLINESSGKSFKRTRRILSTLLPQLGERTWCGQLDAQGLNVLYGQLRACASKTTSVACHQLSRGGRQFLWVVGRKHDFDEQGRICFRTRTLSQTGQHRAPTAPGWTVLRSLTRLAALLHDMGKASVLFNSKLRNPAGPQSEPLRHELLSYLIVLDSLAELGAGGDGGWLKALAENPRAICAQMTEGSLLSVKALATAEKVMRTGSSASSEVFPQALKRLLARRPWLACVAWLVLTHHRLPGTATNVDLSRHKNEKRSYDADAALNFVPAAGLLPWGASASDTRWLDSVRATAGRLAELNAQHPAALGTTDDAALICAHVARPALILGDYMASVLKRETHAFTEEVVLANTQVNKDGVVVGGDSLATHLLSAREHSDTLYRLRSQVPTMFRHARLPADSPVLAPVADPRFSWQQRAAEAIAQLANLHSDAGLFAVVASGTGAGKTRAGVRIMHAASGGVLRYSLALSRRSLTLQAGKDYINDAGFQKGDLAVAVGSAISVTLSEMRRSPGGGSSATSAATSDFGGSSSLDALDDGLEIHEVSPAVGSAASDTPASAPWDSLHGEGAWVGMLKGADESLLHSKKLRQLIDIPVLLATVDHLVGAVELTRGKQSLLSLRLLSSDLLLDEIDNYNANDMVSLGKLVFAAGVYRRRVVLMSATIAPAIAQSLYSAYGRGLALASILDGRPPTHLTAVVSDELAPDVRLGTDVPSFMTNYTDHMRDFVARTEVRAPRHIVKELDVSAAPSFDDVVSQVMASAKRLHLENALVDSQTGVAYSVGFVRWSTARSCVAACRAAEQLVDDSDTLVKVVSYHAKQTLLALHFLDETLGRVLKRRGVGDLTMHVEIQGLLAEAKATGKKNVVIVVMATSLLETGRDHDYDWCILEPRSPRAETQAMGRVRRHRPGCWTEPNVLVLSRPVRALADARRPAKGRPLYWRQPGIERQGSPFKVLGTLNASLRPVAAQMGIGFGPKQLAPFDGRNAAEVLPISKWLTRVSARACIQTPLTYEENRIGALEQMEMHARLVAGCGLDAAPDLLDDGTPAFAPLPPALLQYLQGVSTGLPLCWSGSHALRTKFRSSEDAQVSHAVYFDPDRGSDGWAKPLVQETTTALAVAIPDITPCAVDASRYWLNVAEGMSTLWAQLRAGPLNGSKNAHMQAIGCVLTSFKPNPLMLSGSYHPLIGFDVH